MSRGPTVGVTNGRRLLSSRRGLLIGFFLLRGLLGPARATQVRHPSRLVARLRLDRSLGGRAAVGIPAGIVHVLLLEASASHEKRHSMHKSDAYRLTYGMNWSSKKCLNFLPVDKNFVFPNLFSCFNQSTRLYWK